MTLAELTIILVILAILMASAVIRYVDLEEAARQTVENAIVRSIRVSIQTYYLESSIKNRTPLYPETLDDAPVGSSSSRDNPFFNKVLEFGITSAWYKSGIATYQGPSNDTYIYDNAAGTFNKL